MNIKTLPFALAVACIVFFGACDREPASTFEHPWKNRNLPPDEQLAKPDESASMSSGWNQG
jgi:hypothetical protein